MTIGIDGNEANVAVKVGIGEYAYEIISEFSKMQLPEVRFEIYLKDAPRSEMPKESPSWQYKVIGPRKLWTQIGLPFHLFADLKKPDIFFSPSHYAPRYAPMPTTISIMDVSYIYFPELFHKNDLFQLTHWTKYSAKNAKKVFTISNYSKNAIIKVYKKKADDVIVTYPGIRQEKETKTMTKAELLKKYDISSNYVLFVGTLQPRKNIARLIEAMSIVLKTSKEKELQLVVVGKKGWLYEEILAAPEKFGIKDSVNFLDFVPTEDLPSLYEHALCYVLPSLYEGFGLPVLEAMKYGCPVITSNVSSLPEAGGDAAEYINPENVQDIAEKIEKVVDSEKLRKEMREKGYKHIKRFSWEKAAKETLDVLVQLGNK